MRRLPTIPFILILALAATVSVASDCEDDPTGIDETAEFRANLTGAAERPDPVTTDATGTAFIDVDGTTVTFRVEVEDIQNVTFAHIHSGATTVAGPIVVELFDAGGSPDSFTTRAVLAEGTFTQADIDVTSGITTLDALVAAMAAGTAYVNVHTTANPLGEIRGQIVAN